MRAWPVCLIGLLSPLLWAGLWSWETYQPSGKGKSGPIQMPSERVQEAVLCTAWSLQIVPSWSKCVIWIVAMATKQHFKHCRTWSQLKAQQPFLLYSTISTTSWNYIFLEQDGFVVVIWCSGWCVKKNESPKVCFYKCKSILQKIQAIECRSFFICCCPRVALQNYTSG